MNKTQKAKLEWMQELTALAESIRDDQYNLLNQRTYAAELHGALKRNKIDHQKAVITDADRLGLTNQSKRDADLNRRMLADTQRETFDIDLKKINRTIADIEIEIEYKRSILQIKLASVTEDVV